MRTDCFNGGKMKVYIASEGFLPEYVDQMKELYLGKNYEVSIIDRLDNALNYAKNNNLLIISENNSSNYQYTLTQAQKSGSNFKFILYRNNSPSGRSMTAIFKKAVNHQNEKKTSAILKHPFDLETHKKTLEDLI
jgi:hypothetical protein